MTGFAIPLWALIAIAATVVGVAALLTILAISRTNPHWKPLLGWPNKVPICARCGGVVVGQR